MSFRFDHPTSPRAVSSAELNEDRGTPATMQRTLHQHFIFLEERLQALRDQLTDPSHSGADRARIDLEIQIAELALNHYRAALDLERELS